MAGGGYDIGLSSSSSLSATPTLSAAFNVTGGGASGKGSNSPTTLIIIGIVALAAVGLIAWVLTGKRR